MPFSDKVCCCLKSGMHACAGHGGWLTDAAIAASGAQAITASGDELAVVWDMAQGSALSVLEGHSGEVGGATSPF